VVKDKIWGCCEILSVWLEREMVLMDLTLNGIFIIFVLHTLPEFVLKAPAFQRRGFYFCVFICNLIFVKENVKWVGVKLSGKFRIIKLLFCSTLPFILLSFLLILNGYKRFNGRNFRWKNIPVEKFSAVKTIKLRYRLEGFIGLEI
jgi:hypothetical protein